MVPGLRASRMTFDDVEPAVEERATAVCSASPSESVGYATQHRSVDDAYELDHRDQVECSLICTYACAVHHTRKCMHARLQY